MMKFKKRLKLKNKRIEGIQGNVSHLFQIQVKAR